MALTIKDISLQECLQNVGLKELPGEWSVMDGNKWIRAIALVNKIGGISNYVLVVNNNGKTTITRDFGPSRMVTSIVSIHPYEKLGRLDTPQLYSKKDTITFLSKNGYDADSITALLSEDGKTQADIDRDKNIVDGYVNDVALKIAKAKLTEKDRINEMKSYTSRIKTSDDKRKKRQTSKDRGENKEM